MASYRVASCEFPRVAIVRCKFSLDLQPCQGYETSPSHLTSSLYIHRFINSSTASHSAAPTPPRTIQIPTPQDQRCVSRLKRHLPYRLKWLNWLKATTSRFELSKSLDLNIKHYSRLGLTNVASTECTSLHQSTPHRRLGETVGGFSG